MKMQNVIESQIDFCRNQAEVADGRCLGRLRLTVPSRDSHRLALRIITTFPLDEDEDEVRDDDGGVKLPKCSIDEDAVEDAGEDEAAFERVHANGVLLISLFNFAETRACAPQTE